MAEEVRQWQFAPVARESVFPQASLAFLPFQKEPIAEWASDSDLQGYLYALCDAPSFCIDESGIERPVNYRSYGKHLFDEGLKQYVNIAHRFHQDAVDIEPAHATKDLTEEIPDFCQDDWFGMMAKYAIAWDGTANAVASESGFFSATHLFECCTDLESSVYLASGLYYRQALQVVRSYIEDTILDLHFCTRPQDFVAWQKGDFRNPSLCGKHGILKTLVREGTLSADVASQLEQRYGYLNACVHGGEKYMVNQGLFRGKWTGRMFKNDQFRNWCRIFSHCVELGLRVLHSTVQIAPTMLKTPGLRCAICHSVDNFEVIRRRTGDRPTAKLRCLRCENTIHIVTKNKVIDKLEKEKA